MARIADQHRRIRSLHEEGGPLRAPVRVGVLGVDQDAGDRRVLARRGFSQVASHPVLGGGADDSGLGAQPGLLVLRDDVQVLAAGNGVPAATATGRWCAR